MRPIQELNDELLTMFRALAKNPSNRSLRQSALAAMEVACHSCTEDIPQARRAKLGAYFTPNELSECVIGARQARAMVSGVVLDPACGTGNLLVRVSEFLPVSDCLRTTLGQWGEQLAGLDVEPLFVEACKLQLGISAILRGATSFSRIPDPRKMFPNIRRGSALKETSLYATADSIVANPPFARRVVPKHTRWGSGLSSVAPLFVDQMVEKCTPSTKMYLILPEVLRTGVRYRRWRSFVSQDCRIEQVEPCGQFAPNVDIDVFFLKLVRRMAQANPQPDWVRAGNTSWMLVNDLFSVSVGPLVDYRSPKEGPYRPFVEAKTTAAWERIHNPPGRRRFRGTIVQPPFVVVRRTSRPSHPFRAVGSIITGEKSVAVENHLIICRPYSGTLRDCRMLLNSLKCEKTNDWINLRSRCRHLSVGLLKRLPMWGHSRGRRPKNAA